MATATGKAMAWHPPVLARRAGYAVTAAVYAALLYALNVRPGWEVVPFLTADTGQVIGLVNGLLLALLVFSPAFPLYGWRWLRTFGDLVTTGLGLAVAVRFLQVFPFDFDLSVFEWDLITRIVLVAMAIAAAVGVLLQAGLLVEMATGRGGRHRKGDEEW